jgi:hypothetical protein
MDALIVFVQHHVRADRDIASMATLRMLSKELNANIDVKYPGYTADLLALKASRLEARGDAMVADLDAAAVSAVDRAHGIYCAVRVTLLNPTKRLWDTELRPRMMEWLHAHFPADCPWLRSAMRDLKYRPVHLVRHVGETHTFAEYCSRAIVPEDMVPVGAVRASDGIYYFREL